MRGIRNGGAREDRCYEISTNASCGRRIRGSIERGNKIQTIIKYSVTQYVALIELKYFFIKKCKVGRTGLLVQNYYYD